MSSAPLYARALVQLGAEHREIIVVDAGLATSMQTSLFQQRFPDRYVNLGIAEANAVGFASGLARRGFKPIVHSFSNFLARRAHDQIAISVALPRLAVTFVGGSCGVFDGRNGPSHFAGDDLGSFGALPNMRIYEPADGIDLGLALSEAVGGDGPAYVRLRRSGMPDAIVASGERGAVRCVQKGGAAPAASVIAIGNMLEETLTAARILADRGVPVALFHVARVKPLEISLFLEYADRTGRAIVIENHVLSGGGAQAVAASLAQYGFKVTTLTLPDAFLPAGDPAFLLAHTGLDATSLAERIASELQKEEVVLCSK